MMMVETVEAMLEGIVTVCCDVGVEGCSAR